MLRTLIVLSALVPILSVDSALGQKAAPHPAKVVIIGIDGVSLNLLEPMAKRGVTPRLKALMENGARGHLPSIWPLRTPQVWTSAVTGKLPGQHGIWDNRSDSYFNPPEVRTKASTRVLSDQRRSQALWGLLGKAGFKTLTVGWIATWPAETVPNGVMVAPIELQGDSRQSTIKGSFYSDAPKMVSPIKHEAAVRKWIVDPADVDDAALKEFADIPPAGSPLYALPYLERYVYALRWSLARARSVEAITLGLINETQPDVVLSYFQCPDSLLHRFWIFHLTPQEIAERLRTHGIDASGAEELHRRFGSVVDACYRDVDRRVGAILDAAANDETLVLVVSDHGFGHAPVPHKMKDEPYSGDHLDDGVIVAKGPGIRAGSMVTGAHVLDVTPTVLHALGQPVGSDMRGKVLVDLVPKGGEVRQIASYEAKPQLEVAYPEGWPPRKKPYRSAADEMKR